jgi:hypothetical protein
MLIYNAYIQPNFIQASFLLNIGTTNTFNIAEFLTAFFAV